MRSRLFMLVLSLITSLVLSEIYLRLFTFPPQSYHLRLASSEKITANEDPARGLYTYENGILRLRANLNASITNHVQNQRTVTLKTNELGFRAPSLSKIIPPTILFLGDSVLLADGVEEQDSYVSLLQKRLALSDNFRGTLVNGGQGATGLRNYLDIFQQSAPLLKPQKVIISLYLNDFADSPRKIIKRLNWPFSRSYLLTRINEAFNAPFIDLIDPKLLSDIRGDLTDEALINREAPLVSRREMREHFRNYAFDYGGAWSLPAWQEIKSQFMLLMKSIEKYNAEVALVLFPVDFQVTEGDLYNFPQRQAAILSEELEIQYLDLLPYLREDYLDNQRKLFFDHCHLNEAGHQIVAQTLENELGKWIVFTLNSN
jgi:lysophospholipase L1-like esterase